MDPQIHVFAVEITQQIIPDIEGVIDIYLRDSEEGFLVYREFIRKYKSSIEKLILEGLKDPIEVGHISSRLLRDPIDAGIIIQGRSSEEKEAHVVGYLKSILQLVYCIAKGIEGWQFSDTPLHKESKRVRNIGKISIIPSIIQIVKEEVFEIDVSKIYKNSSIKNENRKGKEFIESKTPNLLTKTNNDLDLKN